jgi:hypothetical protein
MPAIPSANIQPFVDDLVIPEVVHLDRDGDPVACRIVLRNKQVYLHKALGQITNVWAYDFWCEKEMRWLCQEGNYIGPTLLVRTGRRIEVTYENDLRGCSKWQQVFSLTTACHRAKPAYFQHPPWCEFGQTAPLGTVS